MMTDTRTLIERIFAHPTAPFREGYVLGEIAKILDETSIPYFFDEGGNLIAGSKSAGELKTLGFRIVLIAHADHPGFHIYQKLSDRKYSAKWFGGAPFSQMQNASVRIHDPNSKTSISGTISDFSNFDPSKEDHIYEIEVSEPCHLSPQSFGGFDFPGSTIEGDLISTRDVEQARDLCAEIGRVLTRPPSWREQLEQTIDKEFSELKDLLDTKVNYETV